MRKPIIGATVGTPISLTKIKKEIDPIVASQHTHYLKELFVPSKDDTIAYTKDVPTKAAPYAKINKIGGMTYKDGDTLKSSPVTKIESVGANLFDKSKVINATETETGFKFTNTGVTGAPYPIGLLKDMAPQLMVGDIITLYANCVNEVMNQSGFLYLEGTATNFAGGSFITITQNDLDGLVYVYGFSGVVCEYNNVIITKIANAPYSPYFCNTLPIPEEVRNLDGYGEGIDAAYLNVLDFEKTRYIQWVRRLSQSEKQLKAVTDYSYSNIVFYQLTKTGTADKGKATSNILVSNFPVYTGLQDWDSVDRIGTVTGASTYDWYWFGFPVGTTLEQAQAVIDQADILVTLQSAEITDISDILPTDNFIGVEGGGSLTFVNEFGYDVPSEVVTEIEVASGVLSDGNAALKIGDTTITEAQLASLLALIK